MFSATWCCTMGKRAGRVGQGRERAPCRGTDAACPSQSSSNSSRWGQQSHLHGHILVAAARCRREGRAGGRGLKTGVGNRATGFGKGAEQGHFSLSAEGRLPVIQVAEDGRDLRPLRDGHFQPSLLHEATVRTQFQRRRRQRGRQRRRLKAEQRFRRRSAQLSFWRTCWVVRNAARGQSREALTSREWFASAEGVAQVFALLDARESLNELAGWPQGRKVYASSGPTPESRRLSKRREGFLTVCESADCKRGTQGAARPLLLTPPRCPCRRGAPPWPAGRWTGEGSAACRCVVLVMVGGIAALALVWHAAPLAQ